MNGRRWTDIEHRKAHGIGTMHGRIMSQATINVSYVLRQGYAPPV